MKLAPVCVLALTMLFVFPCIAFVKATPYGEFDVYAPTAYSHSSSGVLYGSDGEAMRLDGAYAYVGDFGSYVQTYHYTNPSYNNYWSPYSNRSAFPPDNATIVSVSMLCVVRSQVAKPFTLTLIYGMGSNIFVLNSPMYYATTTDTAYSYNITTGTSWNASELKSAVPNKEFKVRVMSWANTGSFVLYVDYVGISYIWKYPAGPAGDTGGEGSLGHFTTPDVIGLMGITGFIGMIGVPAASIWFFRHDGGGSKIYAGVMALAVFTVCFGLFYASINGG